MSTVQKSFLMSSAYLSSFFYLFLAPSLSKKPVENFNGTVGLGVIWNFDISLLISSYFYSFFCLIFITFSTYHILSKINNYRQLNEEQLKIIFDLATFGLAINILASFYRYYQFDKIYLYCFILYSVIFTVYYCSMLLSEKRQFVNISIIASISLSLVTVALTRYQANKQGLVFVILFVFFLICFYIINIILKQKKISNTFLCDTFKAFALSPILLFLLVEILHYCLFKHHVEYISRAFEIMLFVILLFATISIQLKTKIFDKCFIVCFIIGASCLSIQQPLIMYRSLDIFEGANFAVPISEFFNYQAIPVIDNFPGHMLSDVIEGIVYGLVYGDTKGAIFTPYNEYFVIPLTLYATYSLLKKLFNEFLALCSTLLLPVPPSILYCSIGLIILLTYLNYIKNSNQKNLFFVLIAITICCIYRLDIGFSFGAAAILCLIYIKIIKEKNLNFFYNSFFYFSLIFLLWCLLTSIQGHHPLNRLSEFLSIVNSNLNWAYNTIGNSQLVAFGLSYILIPSFLIIILCFIYFTKENILLHNRKLWVASIVFLILAYFFNFPRALVRHNLVEMAFHTVLWTVPILLPLIFALFSRQKSLFFVYFIICFLFCSVLKDDAVPNQLPFLQKAIDRSNGINRELTNNRYPVHFPLQTRVLWEDAWKTDALELATIINTLTAKDETFLDFRIKRENVYARANQKINLKSSLDYNALG